MVILIGLTFQRQYHSSRPKACGTERETEKKQLEKKKILYSVPWESGVNSIFPNDAGEY